MNSTNNLPNSLNIQILQSPIFARKKKKLKRSELPLLDKAIIQIIKNPKIGSQKKGNLAGVWVYKFKINKQEILLAYQFTDQAIILLTFGVHENFYRDAAKKLFWF